MKCFPSSPLLVVLMGLSLSQAAARNPEFAKLAAIQPAMEAELAAHHAAGVVTLVMKNGAIVHHEAAGFADLETQEPMRKDALFWMVSMT